MNLIDPATIARKTKYDRIMVYVYNEIVGDQNPHDLPEDLLFNLDTVRQAMDRAVQDGVLDKRVKNVADIKYTYDARKDLPLEVRQHGERTWLQVAKGQYKFKKTKRKNLIDLPGALDDPPEAETIIDPTPRFVSDLISSDEQGTFTRVRNAGLISQFLGYQAWPIQGHARTTVSYGQIEVDEVQAGLDRDQVVIVPISGKGGQDKLSWSQALNLNTFGAQKAGTIAARVRSLGLWRDYENAVWIVEFTPNLEIDEIEIAQVRRFKFRTELQ